MSQFLEYLKMAVSNIKTNKMRSLLTMLGIIIGISSVLLIVSLGNGAKSVITDAMADIGSGQIAIYSYDDSETYDITNDDIEALYEKVDGIRAISSSYSAEGSLYTKKGEFKTDIIGQMPDYQYFSSTGLLKGRYFTEKEYLSGQQVAVIGEKDALRIFGSTDVLNKEISMDVMGMELTFRIIGVEEAEKETLFTFTYEDSPIYLQVPLTVFSQIYGMEDTTYWNIMILAEEGADTYKIASVSTALL